MASPEPQKARDPRECGLDGPESVVKGHRCLGQRGSGRHREIERRELVDALFEGLAIGSDLGAEALNRGAHSGCPSAAMRARRLDGALSVGTRSTVHPSAVVTSARQAKYASGGNPSTSLCSRGAPEASDPNSVTFRAP
jgi:hypothetical protein